MRDSDTYMEILEEGGVAELKKMILRLGQKSFGPADQNIRTFLAGIDDLDRLELLHERILDVKNWRELLAKSS